MIPKIVNNLFERTLNSVSMNTTVERALSSSSSSSPSASSASTSSSIVDVDSSSNSKAMTTAVSSIMACSPATTTNGSDINSRSVQSLQSKLLAARKLSSSGQIDIINGNIKSNVTAAVVLGQDGYPLCQYRKGFFIHLKLRSLITSTLRIMTQQSTILLANFMSEQLEHDMKRNILVNDGELTQMEADLQAEEWETVEWNKRWKLLPMKLVTALTKYHAVTLILRLYEYITDKLVLRGDLQLMDKITMDPFQMSKRISLKIESKPNCTETVRDYPIYVGTTMTSTTFYANLLSFCADYSLHQGLLCYGYYKYYNYQRTKRLDIATSDLDSFGNSDSNFTSNITEDEKILAKDLGMKSSKLLSNRGLGLICNAVGGGIGSIIWPGWGTIIFSSLGDSFSGMVLDDGYNKTLQSLQEKQRKEEQDDMDHQSQ